MASVDEQKVFDIFRHVATGVQKQEFKRLNTKDEQFEYAKKIVDRWDKDYTAVQKEQMEALRETYENISNAFEAYKATEEKRTKSVVQNYSSMIAIAIHCKEFTGGAPIPVEGCGVEIAIAYEGVGYYGISIVSGKDEIEKYGITEDDLTPTGRDQLYRISGNSLARIMHDYCMVMHDPKTSYKEE